MNFLSEKFLLSVGSANRESHVLPVVPCPGKKAFASPKKAVVPLFQMRASAVQPGYPLPPGLFAETRGV